MSVTRVGVHRLVRILRRGARVLLLVLAAIGAGFGATLGAARLAPRPAVFLPAGLALVTVVAAAGCWLVLRGQPRHRRARSTVLSAALLLVVTTLAVTTSLPDHPATPPPVPGLAYWQLDTGSRLAYVKRAGTGPVRSTPVVVLHGGPGIPDMAGDVAFFGQLAGLGFDVYVYDQLGAGSSTRLTGPTGYSIDRDVADLEQIRRVIGAEQMILIGHSYGAGLAAHYLAGHPGRVAKLVLSSPAPIDPADRSSDRATAGLEVGPRLRSYVAALAPRALLGYALLQVNPVAAHAYLGDAEADARNDTILTITAPALHCSPQLVSPVHGSGFYALQYPQSATAHPPRDIRPALTGLPTPTLIFKGSCDYLSWHSATTYRQALPDSELIYLPGAGHNTYQDQPGAVINAIRAFLTAQTPPQAPYQPTTPPDGYQGPP
ncbi:hypothetical protein BA895_22750 [Humibacillus sp. DSM 29435]|uniref:alpha/beta fold hydrolase n=1 Tax=Humibacillus sp. DSM 29435 TaxID=1869167 RepID=UPI000871DD57|nr:alpha/beta hydrolase [Humibacillus sp. DSM 29435]OFE15190.1 hypothetical protein BA895_22750 [Humibacillus sp. DSM 29435]